MSSTLTVGLLGATGYVGKGICDGLVQAARQRKLALSILHRPGADTSRYPSGIATRVLDLESGDIVSIQKAVAGLQVVVCAISGRANTLQHKLIEALEGSKDLVTVIPSDWATPILPEVLETGKMAYASEKAKVVEHAKRRKVPCTPIANGTTPELLFTKPHFSSCDVQKNTMTIFVPDRGGKRGLTSKRFTGAAVAHLLTERLHDLPNRSFSIVEQPYSAQDIIATLTEYNDQKPTITEYTQKDFEADLAGSGVFGASGKKALSVGVEWPGETISDVPGWKHKTLLEWVRESQEDPSDELEWKSRIS